MLRNINSFCCVKKNKAIFTKTYIFQAPKFVYHADFINHATNLTHHDLGASYSASITLIFFKKCRNKAILTTLQYITGHKLMANWKKEQHKPQYYFIAKLCFCLLLAKKNNLIGLNNSFIALIKLFYSMNQANQ